MRIDSYQHFWKYNPAHQVWMTEAMDVLRRDYLPNELRPLSSRPPARGRR
jgi:L-fuconolactonase